MMAAETIRHGEPRFDALRPAVFDPADFEVFDYVDTGTDWETGRPRDPEGLKALAGYFPERDIVTICDHCGNRGLVYLGIVRQLSTGDLFIFGSSCVARATLRDRAEWKLIQFKRLVASRAERRRLAEKAAYYLNANDDIRTFLLGIDRGEHGEPQDAFDFVNSLDRALNKYGELTSKQAASLRRVITERPERERRGLEIARERAEREAAKGPAPSGRTAIEGEVVSVKIVDGYMNDEFKMVVRLDNGAAVWLTVPAVLSDLCYSDNEAREGKWVGLADWLHGKRVALTATFTVSDRDEHFAFGKRPTGTRIVEEER